VTRFSQPIRLLEAGTLSPANPASARFRLGAMPMVPARSVPAVAEAEGGALGSLDMGVSRQCFNFQAPKTYCWQILTAHLKVRLRATRFLGN
jgi:hypothetical protein